MPGLSRGAINRLLSRRFLGADPFGEPLELRVTDLTRREARHGLGSHAHGGFDRLGAQSSAAQLPRDAVVVTVATRRAPELGRAAPLTRGLCSCAGCRERGSERDPEYGAP